jgi:molybdopterin synthase catalytic subunit
VHRLEYEAYEEHVEKVLRSVADEAREKWPSVGRIVLLHRVGEIAIGESAVVVAVSAPHRPEAFEAARHCIDTVKKTAPIWKREAWSGVDGSGGGEAWGFAEDPGRPGEPRPGEPRPGEPGPNGPAGPPGTEGAVG